MRRALPLLALLAAACASPGVGLDRLSGAAAAGPGTRSRGRLLCVARANGRKLQSIDGKGPGAVLVWEKPGEHRRLGGKCPWSSGVHFRVTVGGGGESIESGGDLLPASVDAHVVGPNGVEHCGQAGTSAVAPP